MSNITIVRTPELIATEINTIKNQTRKMVLYNSIEIGRRLVEVKSMLPHGEWGNWLEGSVAYSQSTANNLMRIFDEYGSQQLTLLEDNANSQALGNLSYTQAVALLGIPAGERENFVNEHDIENMSTRELQEAIKQRDEAVKKLKEVKLVAEEKNNEAQRLLEEKQKFESDVKLLRETLEKERENAKNEISRLQEIVEYTKNLLEEAKNSGNSEDIDRLQALLKETENELKTSNERAQELERQLKEKPIEVPVAQIVEKIPEEIEKELQELRSKVNLNNNATVKFKVYFDELVKAFQNLLGSLEEIKVTDKDLYGKYHDAVISLINKMSERL